MSKKQHPKASHNNNDKNVNNNNDKNVNNTSLNRLTYASTNHMSNYNYSNKRDLSGYFSKRHKFVTKDGRAVKRHRDLKNIPVSYILYDDMLVCRSMYRVVYRR